jgi:plasmid replication initiation protein
MNEFENKLIVKSNDLIEASYRLSTQGKKLILILLSKIGPDDQDFKIHKIKIKEIQKVLGIENKVDYVRLKALTKTLRKAKIDIPNRPDLDIGWLSSSEYIEKEGYVELCFDPKLKKYLLDLKEFFTKYYLKNAIKLNSAYSIRIYELLKQYERISERKFSVDHLKYVLGIQDSKYKLYGDFKRYVINPAQKDIKKNSDISFNYKEIKEGHKVAELLFLIKSQPIYYSADEAKSEDESLTNQELYQKLKGYYRLTTDQAKSVLNEFEKDPERISKNLAYVEKRFATGQVKNIGSYTVKAIKHNYTDQLSLFEVEKEEKEKKFKTQQFEKEAQERQRQDYERYVKGQVEQFKKTLPDSQIDEIRQKVTSEIESQYKRKSAGFNKMVDIGMLAYFKKEAGLPEFEDWAKEMSQ